MLAFGLDLTWSFEHSIPKNLTQQQPLSGSGPRVEWFVLVGGIGLRDLSRGGEGARSEESAQREGGRKQPEPEPEMSRTQIEREKLKKKERRKKKKNMKIAVHM